MDVKSAVARAKDYVNDLFADAGIEQLDLEETEYRNGEWRIGLSFAKPAQPVQGPLPSPVDILAFARGQGRRRVHKVVIMGDDGDVTAMKDRAWMERAD